MHVHMYVCGFLTSIIIALSRTILIAFLQIHFALIKFSQPKASATKWNPYFKRLICLLPNHYTSNFNLSLKHLCAKCKSDNLI